MNAEEAIVANAEHHTRLLKTIADLEYVAMAKKQQMEYVKDLERQLTRTQKQIEYCATKTTKERKEHEALRDSTSKRLAHKLLGKKDKYEARESKEEREYVEALEQEMSERAKYTATSQLNEEAKNVLEELNDKETLYESAQAELQALYQRVFEGPSENFPEDDKLEYDLNEATKQHEKALELVNAESRAAELLARASRAMDSCQKCMQEALSYSRYDMWGGGTMTDMLERNALANAQTHASQVEMLVEQAMRMSPAVQPVGRVNIARGSIVSDVFFDNIFTDLNFHNKIKQSAAQVLLSNQRLRSERDAARRRAAAAGSRLNQFADTLDKCRRELYNFRRATFETYAAQNPPPPSYDVVANVPRPSSLPSTLPPSFPQTSAPAHPFPSPSPYSTNMDDETPPPVLSSGALPPMDWGSRNPYASAISDQTRKLSDD